jgi:hypothetical protein
MDFSEIRTFPVQCTTVAARKRPKFLSQYEFAVIVCAASGISAYSREFKRARVTFAVEWSKKGKKTILHQDCCNPKLR